MIPSSTELSYFYEAASVLNLSKAAINLSISQPALTMAIQRLELSIGAPLFIRHKKGVTLTQAGKQFLLHVKPLLHYWESAKSQSLKRHQEVEGQYSIGCHATTISQINKFLPELLENYPKLEVNLIHDGARKITQEVINLSIDIAIVANPVKHPDLIILKLYDNEFSFWHAKSTRKLVNIETGEAVIICHPDLPQTQLLLKKIKRSHIKFSRLLTTNSLEAVVSLTASGCGIGILPACLAKTFRPATLSKIIKSPTHSDELCLIYRHDNRNIHAVKVITTAIKKFLRE